MKTLQPEALVGLFEALIGRGYKIVGPSVVGSAIVYRELGSPEDLPVGWTEEQDGGTYRLVRRNDKAYFGYAVGPQSWKQFLFPPRRKLWSADRSGASRFELSPDTPPDIKYAFIGARACELRAISIQDRVFLQGEFVDDVYRALREKAFIVAVNCSQAAATCFCASMGAGPDVTKGFDIALTEVLDEDQHYFAAEVGTDMGAELLAALETEEADPSQELAAKDVVVRTASQMGRSMDTDGLKKLLYDNYEHPRWSDVGERCLTCGNCTMVCPTCFCSTVEDTNDFTGEHAERWRRWDSCFTIDFSYLYGGNIRRSSKSRYRQWMTHKLAAWQDQFGVLGCVGCGRCITWCPVGIDITEEVRAIRTGQLGSSSASPVPSGAPRRGGSV
jgi:sulfhydrogenase subunit beta (sulfur reductase)